MEHIKKEFQGLKMKQLLDKDTKKKNECDMQDFWEITKISNLRILCAEEETEIKGVDSLVNKIIA
jgi:hypothetical protein